MRLSLLFVGASLLLLAGCGGGGGGQSAIPLNITPPSAYLAPGGQQQFLAAIPNVPAPHITWSVQEAGGGTITQTGLYTAPGTAGTYHVQATGNPGINATNTATVTVHPVLSITPTPVNMTLGQSQQFNVQILGAPGSAVTWSIQEGAAGGTITQSGLYTPSGPGTFHIIVTSNLDAQQSATAVVTVAAGSASGTIRSARSR